MSTLQGRVAVVTGSSRGIGRALALGLAKSGCHVVIAAKSVASTEKLPGSIFSVAAEVEALGAQALAVQVDVRDEQQIENLAARTRERFGRIDLLINNAGALYWNSLLETPALTTPTIPGQPASASSARGPQAQAQAHHQAYHRRQTRAKAKSEALRHIEAAHVEALPVLHPHAAGIDIGSRSHWVCVGFTSEAPSCLIRAFPAHTAGLKAIAAFLREHQVTTIALESTGIYWVALYELLRGDYSRAPSIDLINRSTGSTFLHGGDR
jgi:NAD(P)-dependent dehydrogenase (short-subunit alcohol dehydrogenase family)